MTDHEESIVGAIRDAEPPQRDQFFGANDADTIFIAFEQTDLAGQLLGDHIVAMFGLLGVDENTVRQDYAVLKTIDPERAKAIARVFKREKDIDLEPGTTSPNRIVTLGGEDYDAEEIFRWFDEADQAGTVQGLDIQQIGLVESNPQELIRMYEQIKAIDPAQAETVKRVITDNRSDVNFPQTEPHPTPAARTEPLSASADQPVPTPTRVENELTPDIREAIGFMDWNHIIVPLSNNQAIRASFFRQYANKTELLKRAFSNLRVKAETSLGRIKQELEKVVPEDEQGNADLQAILAVLSELIEKTEKKNEHQEAVVTTEQAEMVKQAFHRSGLEKYLVNAASVELRPPEEKELFEQVRLELVAGKLDPQKFDKFFKAVTKHTRLKVMGEILSALYVAAFHSEGGKTVEEIRKEIVELIKQSISDEQYRVAWKPAARGHLDKIKEEEFSQNSAQALIAAIKAQSGTFPLLEATIKFMTDVAKLEKKET